MTRKHTYLGWSQILGVVRRTLTRHGPSLHYQLLCITKIRLSELKTDDVCITLETEYPFKNELVYRIDAGKAVQLVVRIPSFAENVKIDGETVNAAEEQVFDVYGKKEIRITFETTAHYVERPYQLKSVKCGSLIFSLPIKYERWS